VDADDTGDVESGHTFLFTLNDDYVIDANYKGNDARWLNHSCEPNCEAVIEEAEGDNRREDKVFIEAIKDIQPGDELTYNYGITLAERHTARLKKIWECRCGSKKCTGTMLQPKR
jgi:SET domain-containing protein